MCGSPLLAISQMNPANGLAQTLLVGKQVDKSLGLGIGELSILPEGCDRFILLIEKAFGNQHSSTCYLHATCMDTVTISRDGSSLILRTVAQLSCKAKIGHKSKET